MSFEIFEPFNQDRYRSRLPVSFDNSMDLYEQIVAVIEYLNNVIANANEVTKDMILMRKQFEQFKSDIENKVLPANIERILEEWLLSGRLDTIINEALFKGKSTIITSEVEPTDVNDTTYWYKVGEIGGNTDSGGGTITDGDIGYDVIA